MQSTLNPLAPMAQATIALWLRTGLGLVFVIGGIAKLERLLTPSKSAGIVSEYVGGLGYINTTFLKWLFENPLGAVLTPWNFLTTLSAFELVSGLMLVAGLLVRPLALFWALLLWSFVFSLPVVTTPGVESKVATYMSPAEFVQIRDIALSGFFFVLYNLGAGTKSLDATRYGQPEALGRDWEPLGLLLRLSLGVVFLVGGLFEGYSRIMSFGVPGPILTVIGVGLVAGVGMRYVALAAAAVLFWYMGGRLTTATSVVGYFNAVKREFALLAAALVLARAGGGRMFAADKAAESFRAWLAAYSSGGGRTPVRTT